MTKEDMNELLADIISMYAPPPGVSSTKAVALRLAMSSVEERLVNLQGDAYQISKAALSQCGTVLEENEIEQTIAGLIMAGAANMNPAILLVWVNENNVHIKASAKEGLIKQHTAEKAIMRFKEALSCMI